MNTIYYSSQYPAYCDHLAPYIARSLEEYDLYTSTKAIVDWVICYLAEGSLKDVEIYCEGTLLVLNEYGEVEHYPKMWKDNFVFRTMKATLYNRGLEVDD